MPPPALSGVWTRLSTNGSLWAGVCSARCRSGCFLCAGEQRPLGDFRGRLLGSCQVVTGHLVAATCNLSAWSSWSSSELSGSYSPSAGGLCILGHKMRRPAEPPRARTLSKYLYCVVESYWAVCAVRRILFWPKVIHFLMKDLHAWRTPRPPSLKTVVIRSQFIEDSIPGVSRRYQSRMSSPWATHCLSPKNRPL